MSDYTIYQDELNNIYLVENDGTKDVKETVFLSYQEAVAELNLQVAKQKRTTLAVYEAKKNVLEVKALPK